MNQFFNVELLDLQLYTEAGDTFDIQRYINSGSEVSTHIYDRNFSGLDH